MNKQTINTQDASTSLDLKGDQKDDWTIVTPIDASGVFKLPVPSFIRLFTIRRIICTHMSDNNIDLTKDSFLQQISSKLDADTRLNALNIVTQLVNHGIKKYMVSCYHEKKDASLIEIIFNKIILNKFQKEYSQLITHNNTNNNKYQNSVFNTDVLMCKILEYLTFDVINGGDLLNCNLVNSQWLYQVWNPHLISKVNLSDLIKHQYKYNDNCNNNENNNNNININIASMWQRVLNAKDIGLHLDKYNPKITYNNDDISLLQRLSMFKNIESICGTIHSKHISILKALISQCKDKIEKYDVSIMSDKIKNDDEKNVLSPLVLVNANHIATQSEYFYIKWSNKCKKLSLTNFKDICKQWCQYVIDNCDCSSIEILNLIDASFNFINAYVLKKDSDKMLENLAKKFSNLKRLQLVYDNYRSDSYMLLFAKYLLPIIEKNNPIETRYVKCIQDYKAEVIDEYEMSIFEGEIIQVHYRNCDFGEEDWWHGSSMFQQRVCLFMYVLYLSMIV